ncbi:alpha/beta hydrolase [Enterococcus columbae]|uniref:X-Pro dipeptidyl-peptidase n=1 Tax=Enterococcus columbae DSM 7374 = ATCC 51263 TaxID=1121865 RepID=S1NFJ9_9ENTE|nr:alpha/beta hydrolase [Enterococcus columbae]EOT38542.1 X-Pro dipeptidyl-peptidase [Enterococcus columbae DSM 7374 = ATCC 51263]EOW87807.1 X-Pro dipeptidyl-peptidase [Enterococcus columbae DSM 7374 = ATCC 51263]OJG22657.1 X-Pro dipeptidyl-peptidase [Enterococcus columbae DSM 7374 = ATCC 51263]
MLVVCGLFWAGNYFYNYAVVPSDKSFLHHSTKLSKLEQSNQLWFTQQTKKNWYLTSQDQLKLHAIYLPAQDIHSPNYVIIAHGYMSQAKNMYDYAKMYHDLGYHVLMPDARGHGKSQGNYIGFGWPERKDYLQWIQKIIKNNPQSHIVLHGVSMGAATVMMTSGEHLPKNVRAIIEDCGYSKVTDELAYQLKQLFHLPAFPLVPITSLITQWKAGYSFEQADALKQLAKNQTPMLFIHGKRDTFVPFKMLNEVYQATSAPKEKYIVPKATHASAYKTNPAAYQQRVQQFLAKYNS